MKLRIVLVELYCYFESTFYKVNVNSQKLDQNLITTFLLELHKNCNLNSIGPNYLFKYLVYQYDYWKSKEIRDFGSHTKISNIIGKKAIGRFFEICKNPQYNWFNAYNFLKKDYGIDRNFLSRYDREVIVDYTKVLEAEEIEKQVFDDPEVQFIHCLDTTTLYNNNSDICQKCTKKELCNNTLEVTYYRIYRKRNEASI